MARYIGHTGIPHLMWDNTMYLQYIPRNMHTVFALLCFVVVIHWLIFSYPSGLLHWHCGNLTIAPVPAKQPWWIWINTSCEFIMNDCITTTKQSTTKPCAYFLGYTVVFKLVRHDDVIKTLSTLLAICERNPACFRRYKTGPEIILRRPRQSEHRTKNKLRAITWIEKW